jgi:ATP-dependent Clp protease ATP-binding subunit ClpX
MKYEGVDLEFEPDALRAVVAKAIKRGTGARALRSILENIMTDIMYELPSKTNVTKCIITADTITSGKEPIFVIEERKSA